jgi:SAM-dependent methyltransferase
MSTKGYVLGSAPHELERLILQDRMILRPITERLLHQAGLKEGMRVLDLGCGTGGVSLLAAEMVGTSGAVVGIDQSSDAIAMAKECARESGFQQAFFLCEFCRGVFFHGTIRYSDWPICADVSAFAGRFYPRCESACTTWWGRRFS